MNELATSGLLPSHSECMAAYYRTGGTRSERSFHFVADQGTRYFTIPDAKRTSSAELLTAKRLFATLLIFVDDAIDRDGKFEHLDTMYRLHLLKRTTAGAGVGEAEPQATRTKEARGVEIERLWWAGVAATQLLPGQDRFAAMLEFDLLQMWNGLEYERFGTANTEHLDLREYWSYAGGSTGLLVGLTLDFMACPEISPVKVNALRKAYRVFQRIARIDNDCAEWRQEALRGDCFNSVILAALSAGVISQDELRTLDQASLNRIGQSQALTMVANERERLVRSLNEEAPFLDAGSFEYVGACIRDLHAMMYRSASGT